MYRLRSAPSSFTTAGSAKPLTRQWHENLSYCKKKSDSWTWRRSGAAEQW